MTTREKVESLLSELPEEQVDVVLEFVQFLVSRQERDDWRQLAFQQLEKAYGADEPDYTDLWNRAQSSTTGDKDKDDLR